MDRVLEAIADGTRREILDILRTAPRSAGKLAEHFPQISRPAVSQHLAVLREAGLIWSEKQGRLRIYHLNASPLRAFWEAWLSHYEEFWQNRLEDLKRVVEDGGRLDDDALPSDPENTENER